MDWDVSKYASFENLRLRPAIDLLAQVPDVPDGPIIDLGCGAGAVAPALSDRFKRPLIGIDTSDTMLETSRSTGLYDTLIAQDIADWEPAQAPALIFSNAALHWLPDHQTLLPKLASFLCEGGSLAVQMPGQNAMPSHRTWADLRAELFPEIPTPVAPGIGDLGTYHHLLSPYGQINLWETTFGQQLPAADDGHPVRHFTISTFARPYLDGLSAGQKDALIAAYDTEMARHYPLLADGQALFPFRRVFFVLKRK